MIPRYTRPEMRAIWTDGNKLTIWLQIELLASEALAKQGVVPQKDFEKLKKGASYYLTRGEELFTRQKELERTLNHDVIAFTTAIAEKINHKASRWLHFGLTSSDIVDTAFAVQMKQSADLLITDVKNVRKAIAKQARKHKFTACIGRSHGIHGEPTTFGMKMALMYDEFGRALKRLETQRKAVAVGKLSGAVGTSAHLSPKIETFVCKKLGITPAPMATQVIQRDIHADFMNTMALTAASIERWAVEFRHLQRTEVLEAEEPFTKGQKGSSAMPHKRNPITWERLTGLARVIRGNSIAAMENVALWHERDISHSSVERAIGPDATVTLDFALNRCAGVIEKLLVYPDAMLANLDQQRGLVFSGRVLLALTQAGVSREDAYRLVQTNAMKVWEEGADFRTELKGDARVAEHLSAAEIDEQFDLGYHRRNIDVIFKRVFG